MSQPMHIVTPSLTTIGIKIDEGSTFMGVEVKEAEMIVVDSPFGKVEITICNGAVMVECFQGSSGKQEGQAIMLSLADDLS